MSRKHFRALADAIRGISNIEERKQAAEKIGNVCQAQNDRFNWSIWLEACGI